MPQETGNALFHLHYTIVGLLSFAKKKNQQQKSPKSKPILNPHLKRCGDL